MTFWAVVLYAAVILVAVLLIALVLVQQSKGGGFGGAFGGLGESILGAQAGSHLTKLTVILSSVFFVLVLAVAVLISRGGAIRNENSTINDALMKSAAAVEAAAGETAETISAAAAETAEKVEVEKK